MLEEQLAEWFKEQGWTWNLADGNTVIPDAEDFELALDEAARVLYNEPVGTQLTVGRMIIQKLHKGHDVYVYVGPYE